MTVTSKATRYVTTEEIVEAASWYLTATERRHRLRAYTNDVGDHCLVGSILMDLGIPVPEYGEPENGFPMRPMYDRVIHPKGITISREAITMLDAMQLYADRGASWGAAVQAALENHGDG